MNSQIGVIGFGNMATAIISGLLAQNIVKKNQLHALTHRKTKDNQIKKKLGVSFHNDVASFMTKTDVLLLAVKPQQMNEVLQALKPHVRKKHLVITVAAGINTAFYRKHLGAATKIVRAMPNMASFVGEGMTGIFCSKPCTARDVKTASLMFSTIGDVLLLKSESKIDAVTAVSGSGPAFVFAFANAMIKGGMRLGLSQKDAKHLVLKTLRGASTLLEQSEHDCEALIKSVASKGGTTQAGLNVLQKMGFAGIVRDCLKSAQKRATELNKIFGKS